MDINWTAVTAIVGVMLGVWNLVQGIWQRRVRLKVVPKLTETVRNAFVSSDRDLVSGGFASIEVTNLSVFPVTIAEVGFSLTEDDGRLIIVPDPINTLPHRLEPRESVSVRATKMVGFPRNAKQAYATTQCKHTCYGDSPVLSKWRKMPKLPALK